MMERKHPGIGAIVTPASHRRLPADLIWAADNGCYAQGDTFRLGRYLDWLSRPVGSLTLCLFATAPDVVGDAEATWKRSAPILPQLRALGYPAALVAQDGFDVEATNWDAFDVLFIGGTNAWKRTERGGYAAIAEAKRRGKFCHVGRVNGGAFLRAVAGAGADSADGTGLVYAPDVLWPRVTGWLDSLAAHPPMELLAL
jgi:hypothetical protein